MGFGICVALVDKVWVSYTCVGGWTATELLCALIAPYNFMMRRSEVAKRQCSKSMVHLKRRECHVSGRPNVMIMHSSRT